MQYLGDHTPSLLPRQRRASDDPTSIEPSRGRAGFGWKLLLAMALSGLLWVLIGYLVWLAAGALHRL